MSHCRFLQLVLYCFVVFTCGVFQNSFAPIGQTYKRMFNDTALEVSMFSLIIPICSILFSTTQEVSEFDIIALAMHTVLVSVSQH